MQIVKMKSMITLAVRSLVVRIWLCVSSVSFLRASYFGRRNFPSMGTPTDYSKWKNIELSDDEDDTHPNIEKQSLFRWRHQSRLERMAERKIAKEEIAKGKAAGEKKLTDIEQKLADENHSEDIRKGLKEERVTLLKQNEELRQKEEEMVKEERMEAWNVDTICRAGFSQSRINKGEPQKGQKVLSEEEKQKQTEEFYNKYGSHIKKFGFLRRWNDSKEFLLERPEICCDDTANYLTVECLKYELEEKHELMDHVAHQVMAMQFLLELANQLKYRPQTPGLISSFFAKIKQADNEYTQMFNEELRNFKDRVRERAHVKRREVEANERAKRLGPGGLDPLEVLPTLPKGMQDCFKRRDLAKLQTLAKETDPEQFEYHIKRCIDSGLWIPPTPSTKSDAEPEQKKL